MTTLSIPVPNDLENFITRMVKEGRAANKADVVRRALQRFSEDDAVETVLRAEREFAEGKGMRGDLRTILKKIK